MAVGADRPDGGARRSEAPGSVLHVMEATIGGTRRHIVDVTLEQRARGRAVTAVVSLERDPGFPADVERMRDAGVDVREVPMVRDIRPRTDLRHAREVAAALREARPGVVHTHSSKAGVVGRWASIRTGIGARVHTPHTFAFLFDAMFSRPKRALIRSIEAGLGRRTHAVVAVSESERDTIERAGVVPADRLYVAPNGLDPARFLGAEPLDLRALGLDPELPTAAVVGLVYDGKGQDLAIDALARRDLSSLQLLFVGPGDAAPLQERARDLGLARRVVFTGPRDDVPRVLAASDFLLLPSRWEGMPYIVLEAMASGLAVVATPVDGARELVEDDVTGFLAPSISPDGIAAALHRAVLAGGSRRRDLGAAGRARVLERHTIPAMVDRLDEVYRAAVQRAGAAGAPPGGEGGRA